MDMFLADEEFVMVGPSAVRAMEGKVLDAMMLQYLHFWLRVSKNVHDGHTWVYNTYESWSDKLGVSPQQAQRCMKRLEEWGGEDDRLVISCQNHSNPFNHTKWYRLNYECSIFHPNDLSKSIDHDHSESIDPASDIDSSKTESTSPIENLTEENFTSSSLPSPKTEDPSITMITPENDPSVGHDVVSGLSHPASTTTDNHGLHDNSTRRHVELEVVGYARDHEAPDSSTGRHTKAAKPKVDDNPDPEVVRLCELLADLYHGLGKTKPNPHQKAWYREMRLLMTKDGPEGKGWTPEQVEKILRWALEHKFWKDIIRSAPNLREHFDMIRGQRNTELEQKKVASPNPRSVGAQADAFIAAQLAKGESQ